MLGSLVDPAFLYLLFGFFASLVVAIETRDSRNQANASHMGYSNNVSRSFHEKTEEREKTEKKSEEIGNGNGLDRDLIENSNNNRSETSKNTVNRQEEKKNKSGLGK